MTIENVKHIILVLSGKGGVGKTTVSVQLSLALRQEGYKVGLLDIDLCGPSVPYMLNLENSSVHHSPEGWVPVFADQEQTLAVMSIGFLLNDKNSSVIWRGPKKTAMIRQFLTDVCWPELDYLIIDTPPGTSDEHISIMENLKSIKCDGAILVTTPQRVSLEDVRKQLTFCRKCEVPILGIIENMSGYTCSNCSECTHIFSKGGGESLAQAMSVPFLGCLPIDARVGASCAKQQGITAIEPNSPASLVFKTLVTSVTNKS